MIDRDRIEKELKEKWKRNEIKMKKVQLERGNKNPKKKREIKVPLGKGKIVQIGIGRSKLAE